MYMYVLICFDVYLSYAKVKNRYEIRVKKVVKPHATENK